MTSNAENAVIAARTEAGKRIGIAQKEVMAACSDIAKRHGIPDGIGGLTAAELLGRLCFVQSLSRDLRSRAEMDLGKELLKAKFEEDRPGAEPIVATVEDPPAADEDKKPEAGPDTADVSRLDISPITANVLKKAGIHQVHELAKYTDEELLGIKGIAAPSLARIRQAAATFTGGV